MKNQAQIERKDSRKSDSSQRRTPRRIHTGPLVWNEPEFEAARRAGRFVTIALTDAQRIQLQVGTQRFDTKTFLRIATAEQLATLWDTTPLYWTEFCGEKDRAPELTVLRGNGPRGIDLANHSSRKAVARELQRRGISLTLKNLAKIMRSGNKALIRKVEMKIDQLYNSVKRDKQSLVVG